MLERAIIADDLTGALDAAAPFAMRGISTAVALDVDAMPAAIATGASIVGVSTDSREVSADAAHKAVAHAVGMLPAGTRLFKKVDSRLKGNIAAELDAIPYHGSLVIPAIPAFGRWMRDGKLGGFGVAEPIDIARVLGAHAARALVPEIEQQADISRALAGDHDLPIGARGLAEALAESMSPTARRLDLTLPEAPAYCVIGSTDPITLAQLDRLRESNPDLVYVAAPNGLAPDNLPAPGRLTVIHAVPGNSPVDGATVASGLGGTLSRFAPPQNAVLILTGGATAQIVLGQLGIKVLELVGEAQPGLPLAHSAGYTIVTKSGGFGDPDTLVRLTAAFSGVGRRGQHHGG